MVRIGVSLLSLLIAAPAALAAAPCQKDVDLNRWLQGVKQEAAAAGVSPETIEAASPEMVYDAAIVKRDHAQGVFQQAFLQFSDHMATDARVKTAAGLHGKYRNLFSRIERQYGVPPEVLLAFWALESDFSADTGHFPILRAVTTLAYDCRRPDFFRQQLIDALRVIERGDLQADEMIGDWAGELGGLQFTPTDYYKYGVDFDGSGRRDLINSVDDMLASGANFLAQLGWRRGEPWLQEVRVPSNFPWDQADLAIERPRSQWVRWGVSAVSTALPADNLPASLLLPMGHLGPAFLVYSNFKKAYIGWNASLIYSTTVAYLATRIAGAPPVSRGTGDVHALAIPELTELKQLLEARGYAIDAIDGKLGATTRLAVKQVQLRLRFPADSYPTLELLQRLRSGG